MLTSAQQAEDLVYLAYKARLAQIQVAYNAAVEQALQELRRCLTPDQLAGTLRDFLAAKTKLALALDSRASNMTFKKPPPPRSSVRAPRQSIRIALANSQKSETSINSSKRGSTAQDKNTRNVHPSVPSTPKFNPDLPETPAMFRHGGGGRRQEASSIRITRSTIRLSEKPAIRKQDTRRESALMPKSHATNNTTNALTTTTTAPVFSFQLADGNTVDLDMSAEPKEAIQSLSQHGVSMTEMRTIFTGYIDQVKSFFTKGFGK
jgi:hypothetical protein